MSNRLLWAGAVSLVLLGHGALALEVRDNPDGTITLSNGDQPLLITQHDTEINGADITGPVLKLLPGGCIAAPPSICVLPPKEQK